MQSMLTPLERRQIAFNKKQEKQYNEYLSYQNSILEEQRKLEEEERKKEEKRQNAGFFTRVFSTVGDFAGQVISGVSKGLEGIYDLGAGIVGAIGGIFSSDFQEGVKNHIAYDWTTENIANPLNDAFNASYLNDGKLGEIIQQVGSGIGQMLPSVAMNAVLPGSGLVTLGVSAAGSGMEEAYNDGANFGQGLLYGGLSGLTEVATEKLFGGPYGRYFGEGVLDKATSKIANKGTAKLLKGFAEEGIEEMISNAVNPLLKSTYKGAEALNEYTNPEFYKQMLQSGAVDSLTAAAFQGSVGRIGAKSNSIAVNLTETETLNKKLNNLWAEEKTSDKSFTDTKQDLLSHYQSVSETLKKLNDNNRGKYIERFNLSSTYDQTGEIKPTILNALNNISPNENKANNPLASVNMNAYSPSLYGKEDSLVFKPTNSSLTEEQKQAKLVFNKLNKGKRLASVVFTDQLQANENGAYKNGIIYINTKANAVEEIVKHELTHFAEGTKEYTAYANFVLNELKTNKELSNTFGDFDSKFKSVIDAYQTYEKGKLDSQINYDIMTEMVAKYTSENLFTNEEQITRLATTNQTIFQKIYNWIKDKIQYFNKSKTMTKSEKEVLDFLNKAEKLYSKALASSDGSSDLINQSFGKNVESNYNNKKGGTSDEKRTRYSINEDSIEKNTARHNLDNLQGRRWDGEISAIRDFQKDSKKARLEVRADRLEYLKLIQENELIKVSIDHIGTKNFISYLEIKESALLPILKNVRAENKKLGFNTKFVISGFNVNGDKNNFNNALGLYSNTFNTIYIRIHESEDIINTNNHERMHNIEYKYPELFNDFKKEVKNIFGNDYNTAVEKVAKEWGDISFDNKEQEFLSEFFAGGERINFGAKIDAQRDTVIEKFRTLLAQKGGLDNLRYSLKDTVEHDVIKEYGKTYNWNETGYLLKDGTRLDLSGKNEGASGGYRSVDHRDIFTIYEDGDIYGTEAMIEFIARGNIRVIPEYPGINLTVEPTESQYQQLKSLIENLGWKEKAFAVDFDNANGDTIDNLSYENNISANKIINDIKYYFKEGKTPYKSEVSNFRYSLKNKNYKEELLKEKLYNAKERNKQINYLFETIDKVKGLEKYKSASIELTDEVLGLLKLLKKVKTYRGNLSKKVRDIMLAYSKDINGVKLYNLINNTETDLNPFAKMIEDIAHKKGELSTRELYNLDLILKNFVHNVRNYDKIFWEGKTQNDEQIITQAIKETKQASIVKDSGIGGAFSRFSRWLTAPIWRFQKLSNYRQDGIMTKVFNELQLGVDKQAEFNMKTAELFKNFFKENKKEVKDWDKPSYKLNNIMISPGQKLSLYMLSKREQAAFHIFGEKDFGRAKFTDDTLASKGKTKDAFIKGKEVTLSKSDISKIESSLNTVEKQFVDLVDKFFNGLAKDAKYETDMNLYGVSNIESDNYFPIRVSEDAIYKKIGDEQNSLNFSDLFSVYSPSFNKQTKQNSKNLIVVENIIDVINRHAKQMSTYYGLALPIKTFNRLYNKEINGSKLSIEIAKVDSDFERYVRKLFSDLQGNRKESTTFDKAIGKVRGLGAKAALGLNLKVLANQFVSLPAAATVGVKYKNIAKGFAMALSKKTDFANLTKYAPMLYDRFREGNNIDVGLLKESKGIIGKLDTITELTTKPIGKIDTFICGAVWNACLEQTKNNSSYENFSEEHYKAAAKLTEEAIIKSQANYLPLYRPAILREQNSFLQLSTMFMSEPLQQFSLLASAVDKIVTAKKFLKSSNSETKAEAEALLKQAKTEAKHAIVGVSIDLIILTLIAEAFKWLKGNDDEDKVSSIVGDFAENIFGMFPFVKDLYTLYQGYDVTNMAYTGLTNTYNAFKDLYGIIDLLVSGKAYSQTEINGKLRKGILGLSQTFGIPLRNLETYLKGIIEKVSPSTVYIYESHFYTKSANAYLKYLQGALNENNEELADTILDIMLKDNKATVKDEKVRSKLNELIAQGYTTVLPKNLNKTIVYDEEKYELTNNQYKKFKDIYSESNVKVRSLINQNDFEKLTPELQSESIKFIYDYYYNLALEDLLGVDLENKNYLFSSAFEIEKLAMILSQLKTIEADKDKNGNSISGSKKQKITQLLNKMKLSAVQKYMLMGYMGYKNVKGISQVKSYIQSLKLTKSQKEKLYSYCGY